MPVTRVPVVHKFGIISHSQRLDLQERLLKQTYLQSLETKPVTSARPTLEVSEEFVTNYNNAIGLDELEPLQATARKMLERVKRKSGLKCGGVGQHVDLPLAWTELSQLAQCKGAIQEECLDVLITSLDQAPLHPSHIPALFYLAEVTLYWLRTDAVHQPFLRTVELKLLRMGQLVFLRLFYHHMTGQLQGHNQYKIRLFTYLEGFADCQEAYSPYPNALLCLRYINQVGLIIVGESNVEAGEVKENVSGKKAPSQSQADSSDLPVESSSQDPSDSAHPTHLSTTRESDMFHTVSARYEGGSTSSQSGALSSSVHDLSPMLWHSLDVWRCVHSAASLTPALRSLLTCGLGLAAENWVDSVCAVMILGDAAKASLPALRAMQNLARGLKPKTTTPQPAKFPCSSQGSYSWDLSDGIDVDEHSGKALSDICEKTEDTGSHHQLTSAENSEFASTVSSPRGQVQDESGSRPRGAGPKSSRQVPHPAHSVQPQRTEATSNPSSSATYTNTKRNALPSLHGWHWEVVVTYADMLADICLHGNSSAIKKVALVGSNKDVSELHRHVTPLNPLRSAGLLDLVFFRALRESHDAGGGDWSWRVRYSAVQGLVKLCRCCAGDETSDGLHTVAWNTLLRAHSIERDTRVLEALKVGQVGASLENVLTQHLAVSPSTIGSKVAAGLSALYLPPLPPPVEVAAPRQAQPAKEKPAPSRPPPPRRRLRTTLREELMLATTLYEPPASFNSRTSFDLKRIVEDQWRKELQQEIEKEETERKKELADSQEKERPHPLHVP